MNRLSGAWFKLCDRAGYIGLLMVPDGLAERFEKRLDRHVRCYRQPRMPVMWGKQDMLSTIPALSLFVVEQNWSLDHPESLMLHMITPEEISAEPGFAFLPSAEYLQRPVVEKPAPEQKPVPSGKFLAAAREVAG